MAKKNRYEEKFNYNECIRKLQKEGPKRLYLIWGAEDYLSELVYAEIKKLCLLNEADDFSFRRLNERDYSSQGLLEAIDAVPFLSERALVEVRNVDINKLKDTEAQELISAVSDIPDYCTVVFIYDAVFEPDKRLKTVKAVLKNAEEIHTTSQSGDALIKWIVKRFAAHGKTIELNAAQRLISVSGDLMNRLIPEIEKLAAYVKGEKVTVDDVNAVAHHIPEAYVFDMTDKMGSGEYNAALNILGELLADRNNEPIAILAVLGGQMRKLYAAKLAIEYGGGAEYLQKTCGIKHDFVASKLMASARKFTTEQLIRAVELCAETDYAMKSSGEDAAELLKECVLRIAAGEVNA